MNSSSSRSGRAGRSGDGGERSWVGMTFKRCPVCGKEHSKGILMHRRMRPVVPRLTQEGWELCDEHVAEAAGRLWLIGVDGDRNDGSGRLTGMAAMITREAARGVFDQDLDRFAFVWIDSEALTKIRAMRDRALGGKDDTSGGRRA